MPTGSRKRYPPEPIDITDQVHQPTLARRLNQFLEEWRSFAPEQRKVYAAQRLEYVTADLNPTTERDDPAQLLERDAKWHLDIQRIASAIEDSVPLPSIRYKRFPTQPELAHTHPQYRPPSDTVEISTGYAASHLQHRVVLRFLHWFYAEVARAPEVFPELEVMAQHLIAAANDVINQARSDVFELVKKDELDIIGHALVRSLTGATPEAIVARELDADVLYDADIIAGRAEYDPFSNPVIRKMTANIAGYLRDRGIGAYSVEQLLGIFAPKELVVLEACARRWRNEAAWPWSEVLIHTELGKIITQSTIEKLDASIQEKLTEYPDLERILTAD